MHAYIVAAHDQCGGIGYQGRLPWHIREDLCWFNRLTTAMSPVPYAHAVITTGLMAVDHHLLSLTPNILVMGRRTTESMGAPLRHRDILTITRNPHHPGACAGSMDAALRAIRERRPCGNVFVCGGADVYRAALRGWPVGHMFLTEVEGCHPADTYFPAPANGWHDALLSGVWHGGDREPSWRRLACGPWQGIVRHRLTMWWEKREEA